jgi:hypothetical protein
MRQHIFFFRKKMSSAMINHYELIKNIFSSLVRCYMIKIKLTFYILIAISLFLTGCATGPSKASKDLNLWLGNMNYEGAIQRLGPPSKCADAGSTKVCTWIYGEQGVTAYMPVGDMVMAVPIDRRSVTINFSNDKVVKWNLIGDWE